MNKQSSEHNSLGPRQSGCILASYWSLQNTLALCFTPWESLCLLSLLFGSRTSWVPPLGWTPEADVMRHPRLHGGPRLPPKQLWERQIQVETCDQAGAAGFPSLWYARMAPWRNLFPEWQQRAPESTTRPSQTVSPSSHLKVRNLV